MALKLVVDTIEGLDEGTAGLYEQKGDGKYHLAIEGYDPTAQAKVKEFRENNINLMKEIEELKKQFEGVDAEEYKKILSERQQNKEKTLLDAGKVDELVLEKTERMRKDYDSKIDSLSKMRDELNKQLSDASAQLSRVLIDSEIQKSVSSIGNLKKGAMQHILNLGRLVWKLESNEPVARSNEGKMIYGKDGARPITFDEWAETLLTDFPYFFEGAEGSGSQGSGVKGALGATAEELMKLSPSERMNRMHQGGTGKKSR